MDRLENMNSIKLLKPVILTCCEDNYYEKLFDKGHLFEFRKLNNEEFHIWDGNYTIENNMKTSEMGTIWEFSNDYA